jgi:RNA polymerase sigma factor (sigma-70 family)
MSAPDPVVEQLYQTHARELHGFARRRVGRQEAEDVVQDAYLHLLQKGAIAGLDHPRAYLFRIAANLAVDTVRKAKIRLRYADDEVVFLSFADASAAPEAMMERSLEMRRFQACLAELPQRCRDVFCLNLIEGLTHTEIAQRLGISVRTVDRHIAKGLDHVRRRLMQVAGKPGRA